MDITVKTHMTGLLEEGINIALNKFNLTQEKHYIVDPRKDNNKQLEQELAKPNNRFILKNDIQEIAEHIVSTLEQKSKFKISSTVSLEVHMTFRKTSIAVKLYVDSEFGRDELPSRFIESVKKLDMETHKPIETDEQASFEELAKQAKNIIVREIMNVITLIRSRRKCKKIIDKTLKRIEKDNPKNMPEGEPKRILNCIYAYSYNHLIVSNTLESDTAINNYKKAVKLVLKLHSLINLPESILERFIWGLMESKKSFIRYYLDITSAYEKLNHLMNTGIVKDSSQEFKIIVAENKGLFDSLGIHESDSEMEILKAVRQIKDLFINNISMNKIAVRIDNRLQKLLLVSVRNFPLTVYNLETLDNIELNSIVLKSIARKIAMQSNIF